MDFDADHDSGKKMYKNTQPTHFFVVLSFFENLRNFDIWAPYGAHMKAHKKTASKSTSDKNDGPP